MKAAQGKRLEIATGHLRSAIREVRLNRSETRGRLLSGRGSNGEAERTSVELETYNDAVSVLESTFQLLDAMGRGKLEAFLERMANQNRKARQ